MLTAVTATGTSRRHEEVAAYIALEISFDLLVLPQRVVCAQSIKPPLVWKGKETLCILPYCRLSICASGLARAASTQQSLFIADVQLSEGHVAAHGISKVLRIAARIRRTCGTDNIQRFTARSEQKQCTSHARPRIGVHAG
eukprot:6201475-Pleurochrysis_carterae.AAC.2